MVVIAGIDPGSNGGFSVFKAGDGIRSYNLSADAAELYALMVQHEPDIVYVEKQPKTAGGMRIESRAFMHGYATGVIAGVLHVFNVQKGTQVIEARPAQWQAAMRKYGLPSRGAKKEKMSYQDWKRELARFCKNVLPNTNVSQRRADSSLIALYGALEHGFSIGEAAGIRGL